MSSVDAMGPGTPTPLTMINRAKGYGSPLYYRSTLHRIQTDVVRATRGQSVAAFFQPRPPVRPPGFEGFGKGILVDRKA